MCKFKTFFKLPLLLFCRIMLINAISNSPVFGNNFEVCNAELENKFMAQKVKCPRNGLFPVKGSCTAFIYCFSLDEDLIKPIKRAECSTGMAFDIEDLRCRFRSDQTLNNCLQRKCYPAETFMEDSEPSTQTSVKEESPNMNTAISMEDENDDLVSINIQTPMNTTVCNRTQNGNHKSISCMVISSAVINQREIFKYTWVHFLVLKLCSFLISEQNSPY